MLITLIQRTSDSIFEYEKSTNNTSEPSQLAIYIAMNVFCLRNLAALLESSSLGFGTEPLLCLKRAAASSVW